MRRTLYLFATLAAFWLLLSGHYTLLLIGFGIGSCLLVVVIALRMDAVDGAPVRVGLKPIKFIHYWIWLAKEIFISNIAVTRLILSREFKIAPSIFRVPAVNLPELERVTYANSITLTPGTVAIDVGDDWIDVHALTAQTKDDLLDGKMGARIRTISKSQ